MEPAIEGARPGRVLISKARSTWPLWRVVSEVVELDEDMEDDSEIVEEVEGSDVILEEKPSGQ